MNKTIHKLREEQMPAMPVDRPGSQDLFSSLAGELRLLQLASKDLLSPRPEAIANLLKMAKSI
jgi:hypothetical protein